ncbi:MAG: hypothetical protein R3208_12125 [Ketobacteraceae bacterium]|nr:hypothetical protein [Ketobacteraceae bacterium]
MTKTNEDTALEQVTEAAEKKSTQLITEAKSMLEETRKSFRDARLTGLGLWDKANDQTRQALESIKNRGAAKLSEAGEVSVDEDAPLLSKAKASFEKSLNSVKAYGMASYEEAAETTQEVSDWLTKTFNEAGTELEAAEEKAVSRVGRNLEKASKALNRLAKDVRESTTELLDKAKQGGKDVDYELRKALFGRQTSLENRLQSFWNALGLVNKKEMAEVNRKLVLLAASVENQLDEESKALVYLNRRNKDRRVKKQPVEFEKRLRDRREEDRMAS